MSSVIPLFPMTQSTLEASAPLLKRTLVPPTLGLALAMSPAWSTQPFLWDGVLSSTAWVYASFLGPLLDPATSEYVVPACPRCKGPPGFP